jgi:hypothetical protein
MDTHDSNDRVMQVTSNRFKNGCPDFLNIGRESCRNSLSLRIAPLSVSASRKIMLDLAALDRTERRFAFSK